MKMLVCMLLASVMAGCFAAQQSSTVGNITASVLGQSGKIRLYKGDNVTDGIVITFSAIAELDDNDNKIQSHGYNNFAQLDFTFSDLENTTYMDSNVSVTKFSFSADIPVGGSTATLTSEVFLFNAGGNITVAGEEVEVTAGTMKFNVGIDSWTFCNPCTKGQTQITGAFLDFDIDIKGTSPPNEISPGVFDFNGTTLITPKEVLYDNTTTKDMPSGYPKLTVQGAKNIFTFRFEKFSQSVFYDPTVDLGENESTDSTDGTDPTETPATTDATLSGSGIEVKVHGQSGKMTVMKTGVTADKAASSVTIEFDNLNEISEDGSMINDNAHKVITFANQEFTFGEPMDDDYPGTELGVKTITFQSVLENQATVEILMYIFKEAGDITNDNETISVKEGDLKFNIDISDWTFCDANLNCPKSAIGKHLDFDIVIKGKSKASKNTDSDNEQYDFGNGIVTLSNEIVVDGVAVVMAENYPKYTRKGSKDVFTFRFPLFNKNIVYDPKIQLAGNGSSAARASFMSIFVLAFYVLIKNMF
ncbi:hypothetical protein ACF0H5_011768 [Mactra antiquata]